MKRLTALAVKGESYLLQTQGRNVLVDGGYSAKTLLPALKKSFPTLARLDVVVCTHADEDHAQGLVGILGAGELEVGEFWLPGSWAEPAEEIARDPGSFYGELVDEVNGGNGDLLEVLSGDDELVDGLLQNLVPESAKENRGRRSAPTENLARASKTAHARVLRNARRDLESASASPRVIQRSLHLVDTAERVRKIAESAADHGTPVRWFDYGEFVKTRVARGGEDFLAPINSVEQPPPPVMHHLKRFVQLTRVNRECLVFLAPSEAGQMAVLFTGDSPLGDGAGYSRSFLTRPLHPSAHPLVVTAPHHGSESNAVAYEHVHGVANPAFWIRTGGASTHPGRTFRMLDPAHRTCTRCPHRNRPLQQATITDWFGVHTDPEAWITVRSHDCDCVP